MFRNRFLSSTAFFLKPDDGTGAGGGQGNDKDPKATAAQSGQDGGGGEGAGDAEGSDDGDAGDGEGDDDGSDGAGEGDDDAGGADDDDDPLAGLSPEQRAKVEKEIRWRDRQINRLTGKRRGAEEDVRTAQTIVEKTGAGATLTEDEVERRANLKVAKQTYDEACNTTDSSGRSAFGRRWGEATDKLRKMGGMDQEDMAKIVLSTDHPETVLYTLGNDPDEYERVMALPPAKRFSEFVKIGLKAPPKKDTKESKRPAEGSAPPRTIGGGSRKVAATTVDLYKDNVDDDAWYAQRNATRRKKFTNVS